MAVGSSSPISPSKLYGYTEYSKEQKEQPLSVPICSERKHTRELDQLFDLLLNLCQLNLSSNDNNSDCNINNNLDDIPSPGTRIVIELFYNIFLKESISRNNKHVIRIREKLLSGYPELQMLSLELIGQSFLSSIGVHSLCEHFKFWEMILFSEIFGSNIQQKLTGNSCIIERENNINNNINLNEGFKIVRDLVNDLIVFAGSQPNHEPLYICRQLVAKIHLASGDMNHVLSSLQSLLTMLQYNLKNTQNALMRLNALPIFAMIVQQQQTITASYYNIDCLNNNNIMPFTKEVFLRSRYVILSVINHLFIDNNDTKFYGIQDSRMINVLFSLLFEPDMRKYAIEQIINLLSIETLSSSSVLSLSSTFASSKEQNEPLEIFYNNYYTLFDRAQKGSLPSHFQLLLELLHGIYETVLIQPGSKKLFRKTGIFEKLIGLLKSEKSNRYSILFLNILDVFKLLIRDSESNKKYFIDTVGYDLLRQFIIMGIESTNEIDIFCTSVVEFCFSCLIDLKWENNSVETIQFPKFVLFIIKLIPIFPETYQLSILSNFITLVARHPLNQSICCRELLIFNLLDLIPILSKESSLLSKAFSLIEILGTHSITVKELKRLFLLLKSEPGNFRPIVQLRLMKTLQFMSLSVAKTSPQTFFDLNGKNSALIIPPLEKWPPTHGYTFCLWFRIEENDKPIDFNPRLVSFLDQDGYGIEIYFVPNNNMQING